MRICFFSTAWTLQGGAELCQVILVRHMLQRLQNDEVRQIGALDNDDRVHGGLAERATGLLSAVKRVHHAGIGHLQSGGEAFADLLQVRLRLRAQRRVHAPVLEIAGRQKSHASRTAGALLPRNDVAEDAGFRRVEGCDVVGHSGSFH